MKFKQAIWKYLIKNGMILTKEGYYGDLYDYDKSTEIRDLIDKDRIKINWDKTSDVKDGYESKFMGTFCESDCQISYLRGTLVQTNGKETEWKMELDTDWSFCETVQIVYNLLKED